MPLVLLFLAPLSFLLASLCDKHHKGKPDLWSVALGCLHTWCVYVYACVYVCICVVCMCANEWECVSECEYMSCACTYVNAYVCECVCVYAHVCSCMCTQGWGAWISNHAIGRSLRIHQVSWTRVKLSPAPGFLGTGHCCVPLHRSTVVLERSGNRAISIARIDQVLDRPGHGSSQCSPCQWPRVWPQVKELFPHPETSPPPTIATLCDSV